jgi:hypothetical protein
MLFGEQSELVGSFEQERRNPMTDTNSVAVDVTIGDETRFYEAFITTAPATFDRPSTLTLYESNFSEVAGWAADPLPFDASRGQTPARMVLIESTERGRQRARYREGQYLLVRTDPVLVGRTTLKHWLWNRLAVPSATEVQ